MIRVALPEQYTSVADAVRDIGFGSHADAFGILNGGDTAATDYFRRQTSTELRSRFQPIVVTKMEEVGVYRYYEDLTGYYNMLPIQKPEAMDLDDYITERTIDGIFLILEDEEQKIRQDPAARTTELLRKVFG